ncbi:MAG: hypothetical protein H7837_12905, partial [Magnetococcus sp. MYC-9]
QIKALSPDSVAGLASRIPYLSATQVKGLETEDFPLLAVDVNPFTLTQFNALTSAQQAAYRTANGGDPNRVTDAQLVAMTAKDVAALTSSQMATLSSSQLMIVTTTQIAGLSSAQIKALAPEAVSGLTGHMPYLTVTQVKGFEIDDFALLAGNLAFTLSQFNALTATQQAAYRAANGEDPNRLSNEQLAALTPKQFATLTTAQFAALASDQLASLNTSHIAVMSAAQITALSPSGVSGLAVHTPYLTTTQVKGLETSDFALLAVDANPLGLAQYNALTAAQKTAYSAANGVSPIPVLGIAATDANKSEGNSGSTSFVFAVTRTGALSAASTVRWAVTGSGSNAASAGDFANGAFPSGTLTFSAGESSKTVTINAKGETAVESDEGFTVALSALVDATLGTGMATGTILNDDATASTTPTTTASTVTGTWGGNIRYKTGSFSQTETVRVQLSANGTWTGSTTMRFLGVTYNYDLKGKYTVSGTTVQGTGNSKLSSSSSWDTSDNIIFRLTMASDGSLSGDWDDGTGTVSSLSNLTRISTASAAEPAPKAISWQSALQSITAQSSGTLSATQIVALTTAPVGALDVGDVAMLTTSVVGLSTRPVATVPGGALSGTQIATLTGVPVTDLGGAALSATQAVAMSTTQILSLSPMPQTYSTVTGGMIPSM